MIRTTSLLAILLVAPLSTGDAQVAPRPERSIRPLEMQMEQARRMAEIDLSRMQGRLALTQRAMVAPMAELARVESQLDRVRLLGQLAPMRSFTSVVPEAWADQDPGDSLYRAAREALNRSDYLRSVEMFQAIRSRYPKSAYVGDSYYWEAYGLMRRGNTESMRVASRVLQQQAERYPSAATRTSGDARALEARIRGELARQGDAEAAEMMTATAVLAATAPPIPPTAAASPRPPSAPRAVIAPSLRSTRSSCDNGDDVQVAALNALMQMDGGRALPILKKVLARRDEGSLCLRRKAIFIVSQIEGRETEDILLATARTDPDLEVREQAVFWLSQVDGERAVAALDSILISAKEPSLQEKALFAMSQHESPNARRALRRYAERSDLTPELQGKAIFWLGQSDDPADQAYLVALYPKITDVGTKERILFSVGQSDAAGAAKFLGDIARNTREPMELRKKALFWMGQRNETTGADIGALYGTFADREIKEQLIFSLSQMKGKAAVDKLVDIARREPDKELRKKAIFWLSQTDDPRVVEILTELLEKP